MIKNAIYKTKKKDILMDSHNHMLSYVSLVPRKIFFLSKSMACHGIGVTG